MRLPKQRSEVRLCSLLIGAIQIIWAVVPVTGGDRAFIKVLQYHGQIEEWLAFMALCGLLVIIGSTCPWRSGRQIGLFLSCAIWTTTFGMWLTYWAETGKWQVSPITMLLPVMALFCIILLANDVAQKPKGVT